MIIMTTKYNIVKRTNVISVLDLMMIKEQNLELQYKNKLKQKKKNSKETKS